MSNLLIPSTHQNVESSNIKMNRKRKVALAETNFWTSEAGGSKFNMHRVQPYLILILRIGWILQWLILCFGNSGLGAHTRSWLLPHLSRSVPQYIGTLCMATI